MLYFSKGSSVETLALTFSVPRYWLNRIWECPDLQNLSRHLYHSVSDADQTRLQDSASLPSSITDKMGGGPRGIEIALIALMAFCQKSGSYSSVGLCPPVMFVLLPVRRMRISCFSNSVNHFPLQRDFLLCAECSPEVRGTHVLTSRTPALRFGGDFHPVLAHLSAGTCAS